jgi:hypothetical protein
MAGLESVAVLPGKLSLLADTSIGRVNIYTRNSDFQTNAPGSAEVLPKAKHLNTDASDLGLIIQDRSSSREDT